MIDYVIGVDVGGTNIRMGAVDYRGNILGRTKVSTEAQHGVDALMQRIDIMIRDLAVALPDSRLLAVGLGIPGAVRSREGVVTQAPNIPALDGLPIGQMLSDRLNVPCTLENDANAAAVGEHWQGAGTGYRHVCCLTLGTGTGGGVIIDGELLRGADGMASELGHVAIQADGALCFCGSSGCLETFASANGILRILSQELSRNRASSLASLDLQSVTPMIVFEHAKSGDTLAVEVLAAAGTGLGAGLATFVNMFNPEIIIIGGGVAAAWDFLIPPALKVMKERAFREMSARVNVVPAKTGDDAGILGSAFIAWEKIHCGDARFSKEGSLTPWGFWQVLETGKDYKVKRIYVHPGHRLSYQKHQQREETWMIASGEAHVVLDGVEQTLVAGETVHIPQTSLHRIGNSGPAPLVFFEVQRGTYFGEDDIVRVQDDYKR